MPNSKQPCPQKRLHDQLVRVLQVTKASDDEITEVLITLLAIQLAAYPPIERMICWEAAVETLDNMVDELITQFDHNITKN